MGIAENISSEELHQERIIFLEKVFMITEDRNEVKEKSNQI